MRHRERCLCGAEMDVEFDIGLPLEATEQLRLHSNFHTLHKDCKTDNVDRQLQTEIDARDFLLGTWCGNMTCQCGDCFGCRLRRDTLKVIREGS